MANFPITNSGGNVAPQPKPKPWWEGGTLQGPAPKPHGFTAPGTPHYFVPRKAPRSTGLQPGQEPQPDYGQPVTKSQPPAPQPVRSTQAPFPTPPPPTFADPGPAPADPGVNPNTFTPHNPARAPVLTGDTAGEVTGEKIDSLGWSTNPQVAAGWLANPVDIPTEEQLYDQQWKDQWGLANPVDIPTEDQLYNQQWKDQWGQQEQANEDYVPPESWNAALQFMQGGGPTASQLQANPWLWNMMGGSL